MDNEAIPSHLSSAAEETLYIYAVRTGIGGGQLGNKNFIDDLSSACDQIFDSRLHDAGKEPHNCRLVLIADEQSLNGEELPDHWIRDQFTVAYSDHLPLEHKPVLVYFARRPSGFLAEIINRPNIEVLTNGNMSIFKGLIDSGSGEVRADYGGNVLLTAPFNGGDGPKQLVVYGSCNQTLRDFLSRLDYKPLELDTSWLAVGHVDEFVSFSPSKRSASGMISFLASPHLFRYLMKAVVKHNDVTPNMVGKWIHLSAGYYSNYSEVSNEDLLRVASKYRDDPALSGFHNSKQLLQNEIGLCPDSIIEIPVLFCRPDGELIHKTTSGASHGFESALPNLVNMELVRYGQRQHALLPLAQAARLSPERVHTILEEVFHKLGMHIKPRLPLQQSGRWYWVAPGEQVERVPFYFAPHFEGPERSVVRKAIAAGRLPDKGALSREARGFLDTILNSLEYQFKTLATKVCNGVVTDWTRVWIPNPDDQPLVDIFEAYTFSVMKAHGITPWFLDSWEYHSRGGGVHCATNEWRAAPSIVRDGKDERMYG